jgi:hypothetical protein
VWIVKEGAAVETRADASKREKKPRSAVERMKSVFAKSAGLAKITTDFCLFFKTLITIFRGLQSKIPAAEATSVWYCP